MVIASGCGLASSRAAMRRKARMGGLLLTGAALAAVVLPAMARAAGAPETTQLSEVVVTAEKRSENLQKVPISMTVLSGADLSRRGIQDLRQIENSVPNLTFTGVDSTVSPEVSIRGITSDARNIGFESGVSLYVDGVYTGRPESFSVDMLDLQQIEVLRGPQGTLFGKNTTAGAINITTRQPTDTPHASGELIYGNYNAVVARGSVSGPIVAGQLDGEVGAFYRSHDGYETNLANNNRYYAQGLEGGQGKLRFTPTDSTDLTLALDGLSEHERQAANQVTPGSFGYVPGQNPRDVNIDAPVFEDRQVFGVSLTGNHRFGDGSTLTSITAYRMTNVHFLSDDDASPEPFLTSNFLDREHQYSEELRYASPVKDRLRYVVGLFYFDESVATGRASIIPPNTLAGPDGIAVTLSGNVHTQSYAAFGQADYDITPALTLTAGLRYTYENKSMNMDLVGSPAFNIISLVARQSLSDSNWSPMVNLAYRVTESTNLYAKVSQGFKSGGFNLDYVSSSQLRFRPETVTAYEVGVKSQINDRIRLDGAAFYMDYNDLQVESFEQFSGFVISNAAKAHIWGLELDGVVKLLPGLELDGGVGYLNATFSSYPNGGGLGIDYTGNQLPIAPHWTANIGAEYRHDVGEVGSAYARVSYAYRDSYYTDAGNDPTTLVGSHGLVDARVGFQSKDRHWTVEVWGKNLADTLYANDRGTPVLGGLLGQHFISYGPPRTYGVRLATQF